MEAGGEAAESETRCGDGGHQPHTPQQRILQPHVLIDPSAARIHARLISISGVSPSLLIHPFRYPPYNQSTQSIRKFMHSSFPLSTLTNHTTRKFMHSSINSSYNTHPIHPTIYAFVNSFIQPHLSIHAYVVQSHLYPSTEANPSNSSIHNSSTHHLFIYLFAQTSSSNPSIKSN